MAWVEQCINRYCKIEIVFSLVQYNYVVLPESSRENVDMWKNRELQAASSRLQAARRKQKLAACSWWLAAQTRLMIKRAMNKTPSTSFPLFCPYVSFAFINRLYSKTVLYTVCLTGRLVFNNLFMPVKILCHNS